MKQWMMIAMMLILSNVLGFAQSQREIYNTSVKAYESKDYKNFLQLTKNLDSIRPFHPSYTYNLALAYALNGKINEANATLKRLVLMNNTTAFENDEDFKSLQETEGFKSVLALKNAQSKVIATSKAVVTVSEKDLHPEGLGYFPKSKIWLASSIHKRKIVSFDIKNGLCTDWLKLDDMLAVFALKADRKEEYLWVATSAMPEMENFDKTMDGKAEVLKVNLKTKQIVKRFSIDGNHVFGDLIVAKNGVVYVSDSNKPILYKIENNVMTEFISFENEGFNFQGLALNDQQDKLFIADYLKGIALIDIPSKTKSWLSFPEGTTAKGIDGLVFHDNTLIAIQNGVLPIRVTELKLKENEITSFKILDNNRPEFDEPALATVVDKTIYFFVNSPWKAYDKNGVLDLSKVSNPILFSCKLD